MADLIECVKWSNKMFCFFHEEEENDILNRFYCSVSLVKISKIYFLRSRRGSVKFVFGMVKMIVERVIVHLFECDERIYCVHIIDIWKNPWRSLEMCHSLSNNKIRGQFWFQCFFVEIRWNLLQFHVQYNFVWLKCACDLKESPFPQRQLKNIYQINVHINHI